MSEPPFADLPDPLKTDEFARALRKGPAYVYAELKAGRLRGVRVGSRTWRIPKSELLRYAGMSPEGGRDAT
jgi:excisionase family DNA binding protein